MANGSSPSNGNDKSGGLVGNISNALENKLTLLFMAAVLGVGGNLAIVQTQPDVIRPDPFTGTQGKVLEDRIIALENLLNDIENNQQKILISQAMDDQHRRDAVDGYARIRAIERQCALNNERITEIRKEWNRYKDKHMVDD